MDNPTMKKICFYVLLLLISCNTNTKQNKNGHKPNNIASNQAPESVYPEVGKPIPEFTLANIEYYKEKTLSSGDLKGKFVILDFWSRYCKSCIKGFPKVNKIGKEYKDRLELFLVASNSGKFYKGTKEVYEKFRELYNLEIPISYSDHLPDQFGIYSVPHLIWIDDKGIVKAITESTELVPSNIEVFLQGKELGLAQKFNEGQWSKLKSDFDPYQHLLINGNGDDNVKVLYRSILTAGSPNMGTTGLKYFPPGYSNKAFAYQTTNVPLYVLYQVAYGDTISNTPLNDINKPHVYGKYWYKPIIEVKDPSLFKYDYTTYKGIYNYSLMVPKERLSKTQANQKMMQRDLKNYFGYEVTVETRNMPYWAVRATEQAKRTLPTHGGESSIKGNGLTYLEYKNVPFKLIISELWNQNQEGPPFIDETGIKGHIDMALDTIITEFGS